MINIRIARVDAELSTPAYRSIIGENYHKSSKYDFHGFRIQQPRIGELLSVAVRWISTIGQVLKTLGHGAKQSPRRSRDLVHRITPPRPETAHKEQKIA